MGVHREENNLKKLHKNMRQFSPTLHDPQKALFFLDVCLKLSSHKVKIRFSKLLDEYQERATLRRTLTVGLAP